MVCLFSGVREEFIVRISKSVKQCVHVLWGVEGCFGGRNEGIFICFDILKA